MNAVAPLPTFAALHDIRDKAILLSVGKAFLCEEVFLTKIGHSIEESLKHLREDILSLKRRFVGKFVEDVDTDSLLDTLQSQATLLQTPDRKATDKCAVGNLGEELEQTVGVLTKAIKAIRAKVEGEVEEYTKKDAVVKGARTVGSLVSSAASPVIKLVALLFVLALGPAIYLGVTMEREGTLQNQIAESKAFIQSQQAKLAPLKKERNELAAKIASSQKENLSRQQKLDTMDLNVKFRTLDQKVQRAETEITAHEKRIKLSQQKIEEIKSKPFLQRFLRQ